jgi:two-component system OmpR family sensor kinase
MPRPAIRLRLTAWYAGSILAVLLVVGWFGRALVRTAMEREFERGIQGSAALVRGFFRVEVAEYRQVDATLHHIAGELVFADRAIDFVRPDGSLFVAPRPRSAVTADDLHAPVHVLEAPLDPDLAPGWKVRLQVERQPLLAWQRTIDRGLAVGIPILAILAIAVGWLLTGRTLRPVGAMARAAERIGAARSSARLPIADAGDELGRLGTRFNDLLDRLDDALAQQRRFLADAAHELRTPLARMRAAADVALLGGTTDASADANGAGAALEGMRRDLERTSRLVDELLQLARADADQREVVPVRGYLDDVVSDALSSWPAVARERGVALDVPVLEETPVMLDRALVERLVGILVDNALRYTPPGGRVSVRVLGGEQACLEVQDTGVGIPPEERPRLFERFFRGATARRMAPDGSGLGLAIAQWIVTSHGGSIAFEAPAEGGTLVRVRLPVASPAPSTELSAT